MRVQQLAIADGFGNHIMRHCRTIKSHPRDPPAGKLELFEVEAVALVYDVGGRRRLKRHASVGRDEKVVGRIHDLAGQDLVKLSRETACITCCE